MLWVDDEECIREGVDRWLGEGENVETSRLLDDNRFRQSELESHDIDSVFLKVVIHKSRYIPCSLDVTKWL